MTAPNPTALAALLRSHPEECAAVVAVLTVSGNEPATAQNVCFYLRHQINTDPIHAVIVAILSAMHAAEIVTRATREGVFIDSFRLVAADRYAIARMGAAAWLAARLSVKPSPIEHMSAAFDHLAAINVVADGLPELERDAVEQARLRLFVALDGTAHAKRGIPEYGEDEVRAKR